MITADEAKRITAGTISDEHAARLMESVDAFIRSEALNGKSYASPEPSYFTDAERAFLRKRLTEQGFGVTEVGLTIFW